MSLKSLVNIKSISNHLRISFDRALAGFYILGQLAFPFMAIQPAMAAQGNNGTLKVHEKGTPANSESNDPKVCVFNFEGFGLDANQTGDITIETQSGTPITPVKINLTTDASGDGETDYINDTTSTVNLPDGHYKATLDNKFGTDPGDKAKSKVFKVVCDEPETGSITIKKNAISDSDQAFHFTTTNLSTDITGFDLVDDNTVGLPEKVFNDLAAGTYTVTEAPTDGWNLDDVSCSGGSDVTENGATVSINLGEGEHVTCTYTNREAPGVDYCDPAQYSIVTDKDKLTGAQRADCFDVTPIIECGEFNVTVTGPTYGDKKYRAVYTLDGTKNNYKSLPVSFNEDEGGGSVDVSWFLVGPESNWFATDAGASHNTGIPNFWEGNPKTVKVKTDCDEPVKLGSISVWKYSDDNGNHKQDVDEDFLEGWAINLYDENKDYFDSGVTDDSGSVLFEKLEPGIYYICEVMQPGWTQTSPNSGNVVESWTPNEGEYCIKEKVDGDHWDCYFGNMPPEHHLLIEKTNNATDTLLAGAEVTYTITVTNPQDSGDLYNAVVGDVLPAGFSFLNAVSVVSDVRGDLTGQAYFSVSYDANNFGQWHIGDLATNEVVTISYLVKVGANVPAGTYENIAFVEACTHGSNRHSYARMAINMRTDDNNADDCDESVFGQDESPDGLGDIFAESQVTIGQVLGEFKPPVLAATGMPIALPMTFGGLIATLSGLLSLSRERRRSLKKLLGRVTKMSRAAVMVLAFSLMSMVPALAGQWTLRVADLADIYQSHQLSVEYKVATTDQADQFEVALAVDGPTDINQTANFTGSRSDAFDVEFSQDGVYQVSVVAKNTATNETQSSGTQTVTIDTGEQVMAEAEAEAARRGATEGAGITAGLGDSAGVVSDAAATDSNAADDSEGEQQGATDDQTGNDDNGDEDGDSNVLPTILTIAAVALVGYYFLNRRPAE